MGKDCLGIKEWYLSKTCVTDAQVNGLCILPLCPKKQRDVFCQKAICLLERRTDELYHVRSRDRFFMFADCSSGFKAVCSGNYVVPLSVVGPSLLFTLRRDSLFCVSFSCAVYRQPQKLSLQLEIPGQDVIFQLGRHHRWRAGWSQPQRSLSEPRVVRCCLDQEAGDQEGEQKDEGKSAAWRMCRTLTYLAGNLNTST